MKIKQKSNKETNEMDKQITKILSLVVAAFLLLASPVLAAQGNHANELQDQENSINMKETATAYAGGGLLGGLLMDIVKKAKNEDTTLTPLKPQRSWV